jgi:glutamate dehydrogenase (NADP+)
VQYPRATFTPAVRGDANPLWAIPAQCAFPSATQNEINGKDAANLVGSGVLAVTEGANMPTNADAIEQFRTAGVLFGPGKAANAGGVTVSGLEMSQDSLHLQWSREQVDDRLRSIMSAIHRSAREAAEQYGKPDDYVVGANIAGFVKVADAMIDEAVI